MRVLKISLLVLILVVSFTVFAQNADARTRIGFGFSYHHSYPYYHYRVYPYGVYPYLGYGLWPGYYGYSYYYGGGPYSYGPYGYPNYYYGYGEVRIEVKPKTAKVYVDGAYTGVVDDYDGWWQRLKLDPGRHRVVIREAGFAPYVQTIRVLPGEDTHVKAILQPGQDRISEEEMRLPPGERDRDHERYRPHRYDRDRDGDRYEHDRDYDNDSDYDRDRDYDNDNEHDRDRDYGGDDSSYYDRDADRNDQNPPPGIEDERNNKTFTVQVEPHDATVYIDGNYYGTADVNESGSLQILLPEGDHKMEIVRPGYETFSQEITVDNSPNKLVVKLHKK